MGYRSRQKKRMKKTAMARAKREARNSTGTVTKPRYWLTFVTADTCCARCAGVLRVGREMVYCHSPREAVCVLCADGAHISYRPSMAWEHARARGRK